MGSCEIVLTADRSFMSNYHGLPFLRGLRFASTSIMHSPLFFHLVAPPVPTANGGVALLAPYHTRRTEAALLDYGFKRDQVVVVPSDKVHTFIGSDTKIVSITARDPLSKIHHYSLLNPSGRESYSSLSFRRLCEQLRASKRSYEARYKVVLEGPGAWQLTQPEERSKFSIDHVIVGEYTTNMVPLIFEGIINGENVPEVISPANAELEDMPQIRGGITEGLVEIANGCNRRCRFCNVPRIRCRRLEDIIDEVEVNVKYGQHNISLRSDDIFNYGSSGLNVNREAILDLYRSVRRVRGVKRVGQSYLNLASAVSNPSLIEEVSEIIGAGAREYPYTTVFTGIESGSPRMIEAHMPGKAWPFKPSEWSEVVEKGFDLLNHNHWVPAGMLVLGFPGERKEDVLETISLIERLRPYKSILVPFIFKAKSKLSLEESFTISDLEKWHLELVRKVFEHNAYWGERLIAEHAGSSWLSRWFLSIASPIIDCVVKRVNRKMFDEIATSTLRFQQHDLASQPSLRLG